jgi:hypothetical protein
LVVGVAEYYGASGFENEVDEPEDKECGESLEYAVTAGEDLGSQNTPGAFRRYPTGPSGD